jgi:Stress responsive A/B Barrel Domain
MFNVTRLIDVEDGQRERVLATIRAAAAACNPGRWVVEPTDPGSRNGGDILAHLRFASESDWTGVAPLFTDALGDTAITRINGVSYRGTPTCTGTPGSVYRALLLRVEPTAPADRVSRFEAELAAMPRYVDTMRAWQLSRVRDSIGASEWTHVFEQEFSDVAGLMGPYLMHPIHWAVVDRWFDPETTDVIVRERICHSFCGIDGPVLHPCR